MSQLLEQKWFLYAPAKDEGAGSPEFFPKSRAGAWESLIDIFKEVSQPLATKFVYLDSPIGGDPETFFDQVSSDLNVPRATVDLAAIPNPPSTSDIIGLLSKLLKGLQATGFEPDQASLEAWQTALDNFNEAIPEPEIFPENYRRWHKNSLRDEFKPADLDEFNQVFKTWVDIINTTPDSPIFVGLSNYSASNTALRFVLEHFLLMNAYDKPIVFGMTGNNYPLYQRPEINRRRENIDLPNYDPIDVLNYLEHIGWSESIIKYFSSLIWKLSEGNPAYIQQAVASINSHPGLNLEACTEIIASDIYQNHVVNTIARLFPDQNQDNTLLRAALELVPTKYLQDTLIVEWYFEKRGINISREDTENLLSLLRANGLLGYDAYNQGYHFREELIRPTENHLKHNDSSEYRSINVALKDVFETWLSRPLDNPIKELLGGIYCMARSIHSSLIVNESELFLYLNFQKINRKMREKYIHKPENQIKDMFTEIKGALIIAINENPHLARFLTLDHKRRLEFMIDSYEYKAESDNQN